MVFIYFRQVISCSFQVELLSQNGRGKKPWLLHHISFHWIWDVQNTEQKYHECHKFEIEILHTYGIRMTSWRYSVWLYALEEKQDYPTEAEPGVADHHWQRNEVGDPLLAAWRSFRRSLYCITLRYIALLCMPWSFLCFLHLAIPWLMADICHQFGRGNLFGQIISICCIKRINILLFLNFVQGYLLCVSKVSSWEKSEVASSRKCSTPM